MARKTRSQIRGATKAVHWHTWQCRIRNPRFWEDLTILHEKLLDFLNTAKAKHKKFHPVAAGLLYDYESFKERLEHRWGIGSIPMWVAFFAMGERPSKEAIRALEELYRADDLAEKPVPYPSVRMLRYHPVEEFLDIRLDLKKPLYELIEGVQTQTKNLLQVKGRQRLQQVGFEMMVFDLKEYDRKSLRAISRELKKPLSTVRSAYLAARKTIGIVAKKRDAPQDDPGPISSCSDKRCREGQKICEAHQAYIKQDEVYLRESHLRDPSFINRLKAPANE